MKLWQKDYTLNQALEAFTVGIDYQLDQILVPFDCMGSVVHARAINKLGILDAKELSTLEAGLKDIARRSALGQFVVRREDEDCHTAIEGDLTEKFGEVGKKIHTGRSRNDQILTTLRLYEKAMLLGIRSSALSLIGELLELAERTAKIPMPGRTHLQIAMPSSVGLWVSALASGLLDDLELIGAAWKLVDQCPLGAAASYGVPLAIDREFEARELGFAKVHLNVLAAHNSRGKTEVAVLDACDHLLLSLSRYAQDLILFSLPEFGYFSLPNELCTGSSIMPQKKNPDGLELLRAKSSLLSGWATQARGIIRSMPTGYNRDLQDTKEPILRGLSLTRDALLVMKLTFEKLKVNEDKLRAAIKPELYATDEALRLVEKGMSFRDAYRQVGTNLEALSLWDADKALERRTSVGTSGNLCLAQFQTRYQELVKARESDESVFFAAATAVLGQDVTLIEH